MQYAVIAPDGSVVVHEGPVNLDMLQAAVGGYIEAVGLGDHAPFASMYINEEGKFDSLPRNEVATVLGLAAGIMPDDYIAGAAVLVGDIDEDGNDTSLHSDWLIAIKAAGGQIAEEVTQ